MLPLKGAAQSFPRLNDERDIRLSILIERCWHTNDYCLHLFDPAELRGGGEFPPLTNSATADGSTCLVSTLPVIQKLNFLTVNV